MSKKVAFHYHDSQARKPIVFETIFAEKNGGGIVADCDCDLHEGIAVGLNADGKYAPIKALVLVSDAADDATTLNVKKGSGIAKGEFVAFGKKSVAVSAVDTSDDNYDVVTVATFGVAIPKGAVLYQAKSASASSAAPIYTPEYILGQDIPANSGDALVKLVNGANLNKAAAPVADEVVALMKSIAKI